MSYLIIVIMGAIVGFIAGKYMKGSEHGSALDVGVGALGGCVFVLLSRMVGPAGAAGWFMSTIVTIIGAVLTLFIMRQFMIRKAVAVSKPRRRF
jgi:uncharacterized membrane protein YeaQ/YmgE (transglycosylase-associated protein family)